MGVLFMIRIFSPVFDILPEKVPFRRSGLPLCRCGVAFPAARGGSVSAPVVSCPGLIVSGPCVAFSQVWRGGVVSAPVVRSALPVVLASVARGGSVLVAVGTCSASVVSVCSGALCAVCVVCSPVVLGVVAMRYMIGSPF